MQIIQFKGTPESANQIFDKWKMDGTTFSPNYSNLAFGELNVQTPTGIQVAGKGDYILKIKEEYFVLCDKSNQHAELNQINFILSNRSILDGLNTTYKKVQFMLFTINKIAAPDDYFYGLREQFMRTSGFSRESQNLPHEKHEEKHKENPDKEFHPIG